MTSNDRKETTTMCVLFDVISRLLQKTCLTDKTTFIETGKKELLFSLQAVNNSKYFLTNDQNTKRFRFYLSKYENVTQFKSLIFQKFYPFLNHIYVKYCTPITISLKHCDF